ncbi:MAG TPA: macrolide ABC transporter ATP-binding protein, partial [Thermodesulfobacteriota bacterium]|nr:macrolide ABC transporter ATP-binding protein [Thermodesulfobacteriota bacterium]
ARAIVNDPSMILADEPTGNLDTSTSLEIMDIFKSLNGQGKTVILITHENDIAVFADRIIVFKDGIIIEEKKRNGSRFTAAEA